MQTVNVIREFFGIRYSYSGFGARPDLTHPDMVAHPLSEKRYVVVESASMVDAYIAAHAAIGTLVEDGPLKGRSQVGGDVEVIRAFEHEPVQLSLATDPLWEEIMGTETVVMTITGTDVVRGVPHWASAPLSRYNPVNGWDVPKTIEI